MVDRALGHRRIAFRIRSADAFTLPRAVPAWSTWSRPRPVRAASLATTLTYYRRQGQRRAGKRDAGVDAGLVL